MLLTGAEIVVECLKEQGVDTVFGYPGGAILNVYDALYKHSDEIRHVLTSHEQGASHAADGYARTTGKVGVCLATSGPGATNIVTGIATAYMDSVPVVAITCNVNVNLLGKDSFQEIDIAGITMPVTKHNFIVKDVNKLADTIRRAFAIAQTGRPGPVLVDIPKDVTGAEAEYEYKVPAPIKRKSDQINEETMQEVIGLIEHSVRPFILVGGGVIRADAADELREFVSKVQAPVADTLMGKGAFDGREDAYTGMVGMHGTKTSNYGITESDLLIAIGTRFSDRVLGNVKAFARHADLVHIDVDAAEDAKNAYTADIDAEIISCQSYVDDLTQIQKDLVAQINSITGGTATNPITAEQYADIWKNNVALAEQTLANYQVAVEVAEESIELFKAGKYTLAYNVEKAQLKMDKAQEAYEVALSIYNKALADVKTILETLTK